MHWAVSREARDRVSGSPMRICVGKCRGARLLQVEPARRLLAGHQQAHAPHGRSGALAALLLGGLPRAG